MTLFCQWLYTPHRWFAEWNIARRQRIPQRMHSNPSRYRVGCNKHSDSTESLTRPKISPKSTIYCSYNFSYELSPMPSIIPPQIFQPLIIQPVIMQHLIIWDSGLFGSGGSWSLTQQRFTYFLAYFLIDRINSFRLI